MSQWRRLDPLMLLVHPVTELGRFLPLLLVAFLFGSAGQGGDRWQLLAVAVPVAIGLVRFVVTTYRITEDRVELRRGLLSRSVLTARLDRVRTVELTASPVHRILGLATVRIGTGAARGEDSLELDSLRRPAAEALRDALLRRVDQTGPAGPDAPPAERPAHVLLRFDPTWARYAPFTSSGVVIAGALLAGAAQLTQVAPDRGPRLDIDLSGLGFLVLATLVAVAGVLLALLAVTGYLVSYSGYALSTDPGRSLHVVRGLLTRRETSLEHERVRGLELQEPLSLRAVGARRLVAAVTGLQRDAGGNSLLVPPAPAAVVEYVGQQVLRDDPALRVPLREHGPVARRRRYVRALAGHGLPAAGLVALAVLDAEWWLLVPAVLVLGAALPLAADRYRRLGHALTDRFLVTREGTFRGRRVALERTGIIGWTISQTFWQRRAGLCDLVATTSAGRQGYRVADVPLPDAVALADAAVPGLVAQFRSAS